MLRNSIGCLIAVLFLLFGSSVVKAKGPTCEECHVKISPTQVEDFKRGEMAKTLDCSDCHGTLHQSETDVEKAQLPTMATCQECHQEQSEQYLSGKPRSA
jgi:hydroxylamine dehydrogenase